MPDPARDGAMLGWQPVGRGVQPVPKRTVLVEETDVRCLRLLGQRKFTSLHK